MLTSIREGLPIALLEAMSTGLACVASRLPGATDAIIADGVDGVLVAPDDEEGFAAAIARLLDDRVTANRLGAAARQTVIDRFSIHRTAAAWLTAYRELRTRDDAPPSGHHLHLVDRLGFHLAGPSGNHGDAGGSGASRAVPGEHRRPRTQVRDIPRVRQRVRNWWKGTKGFREERPNLFVYSPIVLPLPYSRHCTLGQLPAAASIAAALDARRSASIGRSSGRSCRPRSRSTSFERSIPS